jgi:hypothetical protein
LTSFQKKQEKEEKEEKKKGMEASGDFAETVPDDEVTCVA